MPAKRPRVDLKKRTVKNIEVMGIFHDNLGGPGHEKRFNDFVEHGFSYPHLTKDYDVVCHESNFIWSRTIPRAEGKRYYALDFRGQPQYEDIFTDLDMKAMGTSNVEKILRELPLHQKTKVMMHDDLRHAVMPLSAQQLDLSNAIMAERLKRVQEKHPEKKICAVIGEQHLEGVVKLLKDDAARQELIEKGRQEYPDFVGGIEEIEQSWEQHTSEPAALLNNVAALQWKIKAMMNIKEIQANECSEEGKHDEAERLREEKERLGDKYIPIRDVWSTISGRTERIKEIIKENPEFLKWIAELRGFDVELWAT